MSVDDFLFLCKKWDDLSTRYEDWQPEDDEDVRFTGSFLSIFERFLIELVESLQEEPPAGEIEIVPPGQFPIEEWLDFLLKNGLISL